MKTPPSALADLQATWNNLCDLDRGRAVYAIQQNGTSIRELAREINCSESLLRHLLIAIQAPVEDRLLAREGKITTNELVRRVRAAGVRRTTKQHEAREFERTQASVSGSKAICAWLVEEHISGGYGEQIVCEAQRQLADAEQTNRLPNEPAPADMPVDEIIRRCKPASPANDAANLVARFGCWLAGWTYFAITDSDVRYRAFEFALDAQFKR